MKNDNLANFALPLISLSKGTEALVQSSSLSDRLTNKSVSGDSEGLCNAFDAAAS